MAGDQFKKVSWMQAANIYEVNLRQYTAEGSFEAFIQHLPRLKDMGIDTIWFMPLTPISIKNRKGILGSYYACSDYMSVNPEFGSLEDCKDMVKNAQQMGFKVIVDWVANHTGWDHVWTKENPDYYLKDESSGNFKTPDGMEDIIELDYENPDMRKAMIDAMHFWITEFNIDGFRCDLAFWVQLDFWIAARKELEKTKTLFWLGEFDPIDSPAYGEVFDAAYTWTWMHKTAEFYNGKRDLHLLKKIILQYADNGSNNIIPIWFTSNHDENSWNGTEFEKYGEMAGALAVFSITWNGIPLIYTGQELPNTKRLAFFEKDTINWLHKMEYYEFYQSLLQLRKNNPALHSDASFTAAALLKTNAEHELLAYLRKKNEHEVLVLINFSDKEICCKVSEDPPAGIFVELFSNKQKDFRDGMPMEIKPWAFMVFVKAQE